MGSDPGPVPSLPAPEPGPENPLPGPSPRPTPPPPPDPPMPGLSPPVGDMAKAPLPPLPGNPTFDPGWLETTTPEALPPLLLLGGAVATPASSGPPNPKPRFPLPWPVSEPPPDTDGGRRYNRCARAHPSRDRSLRCTRAQLDCRRHDRSAAQAADLTRGRSVPDLHRGRNDLVLQIAWPEARSCSGNFSCHSGRRCNHGRRRQGQPGIQIGHLFWSRHRRRDHLHRIRAGQTKGGHLTLRHCRAGRDCADIHLGRRPHLLRYLGSRSHRGLGQCRSSLTKTACLPPERGREAPSTRAGWLLRNWISADRAWARRPRFPAACFRARP